MMKIRTLCAVNVDRNPALIEIQVRVLESPIASTVLYRYRVVLFRRRLRSHARPPYLPAAFCFPTQRAHALSPYRTRRERRARALGFKRSCKLYRYCEQLDARRGYIHVRRQERYRLFVFHRVRKRLCTSSHQNPVTSGERRRITSDRKSTLHEKVLTPVTTHARPTGPSHFTAFRRTSKTADRYRGYRSHQLVHTYHVRFMSPPIHQHGNRHAPCVPICADAPLCASSGINIIREQV